MNFVPEEAWKSDDCRPIHDVTDGDSCCTTPAITFNFSISNMLDYFNRNAVDGNPNND